MHRWHARIVLSVAVIKDALHDIVQSVALGLVHVKSGAVGAARRHRVSSGFGAGRSRNRVRRSGLTASL